MGRHGLGTTRDEFEVNVFGLQRLAQNFGPGMVGRGADGVRAAAAFVDVLSVYGLANWGEFGSHSASTAARAFDAAMPARRDAGRRGSRYVGFLRADR